MAEMRPGVVMAAAGWEHVALAWASLRTLRELGCQWPIELWHLGPGSITPEVAALFSSQLDVVPVDAHAATQAARLESLNMPGLAPPHRREAEVHCLKGDPLAYVLPPVAVHLSNLTHILLMFPDWVAYENVCALSTWSMPSGSSAFFHAGSARVQDLAYYPRAWSSLGIPELLNDEWEVDESALFLDKSRCPSGASTVLELVSSNAAHAREGWNVSGLLPCGTNAYWRPAWELAGCAWHFSQFLPALVGWNTKVPADDPTFLGGGRGARDTHDGRLLGVHFQWAKYYWLSRPSPQVPILVDRAMLDMDATLDTEVPRLTVLGFANYPHFHFVQYENCSRCSLRNVPELISGSWRFWLETWSSAWREAFTMVASCPEDDQECWSQVCPPRPCTLIGVPSRHNVADHEATSDEMSDKDAERSKVPKALWEESSVERAERARPSASPPPLPGSFGELWANAGFARVQRWRQLFAFCCEPLDSQSVSATGPTESGRDLEGCDASRPSTTVSAHLLEIVELFASWAALIVTAVDVRGGEADQLTAVELREHLAADLQLLEGLAERLRSRDLPALEPELARFWQVFEAYAPSVLAALLADTLDPGELAAAVYEFGGQTTLWLSLLHGAQMEADACAPLPPRPARPASLAAGLGHLPHLALIGLTKLTQEAAEEAAAPRRGVEVGTRVGLFAESLLRADADLELLVVDAWEHVTDSYKQHPTEREENDFASNASAEAAWRRLSPLRPRIHLMTGDSLAASSWIKEGSLDLVFLDADHSYEAVKADLAAWAPKLKPGGLLSGHDYNSAFPGVVQAVREFMAAGNREFWLGPDSLWFTLL